MQRGKDLSLLFFPRGSMREAWAELWEQDFQGEV